MEQNLKQHLKSIKIVHFALIAGVVFFLLASVLMNYSVGAFIENQGENDNFVKLFLLVFNILAIGSIIGGNIVFRKRMEGIKRLQLTEKLAGFRDAMIVRDATVEGSCFAFVVGFMLTGSSVFMFEAILLIGLLIFYSPTNNRIANEVNEDVRKFELQK